MNINLAVCATPLLSQIDKNLIVTVMSLLSQINVGLLAIVVTLVTLVPTLIEIATSRSPNFLIERNSRRRLSKTLKQLSYLIWIFGFAVISSLVAIVYPYILLAIITVCISIIGIMLLILDSYVIANQIRIGI